MAEQNRQWQTRQDGLDDIFQTVGPVPKPGDGQVLVRVKAVSLNYRDTEVAMGLYSHHKTIDATSHEPIVLCSDMCAEVISLGPNVSAWKPGDRVMGTFCQDHLTGSLKERYMTSGVGLPQQGVLQDYRVYPEAGLVRTPDYLSDEEAACLPVAAVTAWMAINGMRPIGQPASREAGGLVVLVQGTGGVSISGLQIAEAAGATTILTSSSDEKLARGRELGADHAINYRTDPDWQEKVLEVTGGAGADVIFEVGGAETLRKSFRCVAFGGVVASIGYVTGKKDDPEGDLTNINVLALSRQATLRGIHNGPRDRFEEACGFYSEHQIHPMVERVFEFGQTKEALKYLFAGAHFGKVVIRVAA